MEKELIEKFKSILNVRIKELDSIINEKNELLIQLNSISSIEELLQTELETIQDILKESKIINEEIKNKLKYILVYKELANLPRKTERFDKCKSHIEELVECIIKGASEFKYNIRNIEQTKQDIYDLIYFIDGNSSKEVEIEEIEDIVEDCVLSEEEIIKIYSKIVRINIENYKTKERAKEDEVMARLDEAIALQAAQELSDANIFTEENTIDLGTQVQLTEEQEEFMQNCFGFITMEKKDVSDFKAQSFMSIIKQGSSKEDVREYYSDDDYYYYLIYDLSNKFEDIQNDLDCNWSDDELSMAQDIINTSLNNLKNDYEAVVKIKKTRVPKGDLNSNLVNVLFYQENGEPFIKNSMYDIPVEQWGEAKKILRQLSSGHLSNSAQIECNPKYSTKRSKNITLIYRKITQDFLIVYAVGAVGLIQNKYSRKLLDRFDNSTFYDQVLEIYNNRELNSEEYDALCNEHKIIFDNIIEICESKRI